MGESLHLIFSIVLSLFIIYGSILIARSDLTIKDRLFSILLILILFISFTLVNDYKAEH